MSDTDEKSEKVKDLAVVQRGDKVFINFITESGDFNGIDASAITGWGHDHERLERRFKIYHSGSKWLSFVDKDGEVARKFLAIFSICHAVIPCEF